MANMPVRCMCTNSTCKHFEKATLVKMPVYDNTHVIMKSELVCGNCLSVMKVMAPKAWRT